MKIEALWQLEVELDGGTLVRAAKGIHYHNVNLTKIRCEEVSRDREIAAGGPWGEGGEERGVHTQNY